MSWTYVWRDLTRNPRRSLSALVGMTLGIGLFSSVLFFVDGSSASMTARAIAPLPLDMQRILSDPLGNQVQLTEKIAPARLRAGESGHVQLAFANPGTRPANEVVIRDEPPAPLRYTVGSTTLQGARLPDRGGDSPLAQGPAKIGLNLGTVPAGSTVRIGYDVVAAADVAAVSTLRPSATFSTRETVVPRPANASGPVSLAELTRRVAAVPGVARADQLSFVDVASGSLSAASRSTTGPLRVFGFDESYLSADPSLTLVEGRYEQGHGLLSVEAARALRVGVGDVVHLRVPGLDHPLRVPISGITDLSRARSLFYSRQGQQLEQFDYVPNSLVVGTEVFGSTIVPAFQVVATTPGAVLRSRPITEVDIRLDRSPLNADPGTALLQTRSVAEAVDAIAQGQDDLVDNISNALQVASADADTAKRLFVFLGLPGALLAAFLTAYAGGVLASALRREQALLRIRGADRRRLLRMHALRTALLAAVGSVLGVGLGLVSAVAVLPAGALGSASGLSVGVSALLGASVGFVAAGGALYLAGRGAINREISDERARLASRPPWWHRTWLDVVLLLAVVAVAWHARRSGALVGVAGSVYYGRPVSLRLLPVIVPIGFWIGGVWLLARVIERCLAGLPLPRSSPFGPPVRGLLVRSVRRRTWAACRGVIMVGLIVALGTSVVSFGASYDAAKAADARFVLGSDLRVTPSPTSTQEHPPGFAETVGRVPGVQTATPVVYGLSNALVESETNEDAGNLAAVDPAAYPLVAPLADGDFVGQSAAAAMAALQRQPTGVLLGTELADNLDVDTGDSVTVLFARGTKEQQLAEMPVIGLFQRLPGFPQGANLLVDLRQQLALIPSTDADFFLAATTDTRPGTLAEAVAGLRAGPGTTDALQIDTRDTVLDKDQSSLAALNIRGLIALDRAYALAMAAAAVAVFVFGLLLQRRREYVTLRAQGMRTGRVRGLLVAEAGLVGVLGIGVGLLVGLGMASFLVSVLTPLFVLRPEVVTPVLDVGALIALVLVTSFLSSLAATSLVSRLPMTELLRDE